MKNKILFIALFFCEAIPTFIVTHSIYTDYTISFLTVSLLALSLIFSWFFADKNQRLIRNLGYTGMLVGIALSIPYFSSYESSKAILIVILSMMLGVNVSLRERKMLAYLLIFSFILFLFASSIVYNKYSILSVVLFTFSFFTVVIADYYISRLHLQTHYTYKSSNSFFGTTLILVVVVSIFTAALYFLLPQPKALHYGIFPFGGKKQYKGTTGEDNQNSKNYKDRTTELPKYTIDGKEKKGTIDLLVFNQQKEQKTKIYTNKEKKLQIEKDFRKEKELKNKNKKAYYSSIYTDTNNKSNNVLFEVKGKEARFLRGTTYGSFNGKSWKKVLTKMYIIKKGSRDYNNYWNGKEWKRRTRSYIPNLLYYNEYFTQKTDNYTITVKGKLAGKPVIYTPVGLLRLQFPTDTFYEDASRVVYAPSQLEIDTYYTASVESESYYGYDAMSYADVWYKKAYSRIDYELDDRVYSLAKKLTEESQNSFEKAQAIVKYFKRNYLYKHSSIKHDIHSQTISQMLFETKVGNALQFNTALIMMLRSSGEYARLATGYAPSEYNQKTNSYLVERKNKAVWTEIFIKDRGWVSIHAADDIPYEGENINNEMYEIAFTKTQITISIIFFIILSLIFFYYARKYVWIFLAKLRIKSYVEKREIDFVISTYKEIERFYRKFQKGQSSSCTLQEYENYIKKLKPENSYLIEYLSFYSNQAIYKGELDLEFNKDRYMEVALYLIDTPFKIESIHSYMIQKLKFKRKMIKVNR